MPDLAPRMFALLALLAVAVGALVRWRFVSLYDFPLADGGLFFVMTRDLQAAGYALPETASYNGLSIPFAYPPLGLYAAALLDDATPLGLFAVFQFLPFLSSVATIVAFLRLASAMLPNRTTTIAAVFAFALVPRSFEWMIMGGGVTRSLGFLFALLALHEIHRLYTTQRARYAATAAFFGGLAALSHLEMAWFVAVSSGLFFVAFGRHRAGVIGTLAAAAGAAAISAPWWITVIVHHGVAPFVTVTTAGSSFASSFRYLLNFTPTDEPLFALIGALSVLGIATCVARGQWLLPAWVLVIAILDPRAFETLVQVPTAMLAGIALCGVVIPVLNGAFSPQQGANAASADTATSRMSTLAACMMGAIVIYAAGNAMVAMPRLLTAMSDDERAAMHWVAANTPEEARFVVVSNDRWPADRTAEWFPAETGRVSVGTVQGYEWVPGGAFDRQIDQYNELQLCADADAACLDAWSVAAVTNFDYVYLPKLAPRYGEDPPRDPLECCAALRASLQRDPQYRVIFDGAGATVFKQR